MVTVSVHQGKPPHTVLQELPMVPKRFPVPPGSSLHGLGGSMTMEVQQEPRAESQAMNP